jgi:Outer membrane protein beta-barrel domain
MTSVRSWFVYLAALVALAATARPADAQTTASPAPASSERRISASINFGAQAGSHDLSQQFTPTIYNETAIIDVAQTYESGPLFDIGGSYSLFGNWGVGVAYSHTSGDGNATIAAQIPHPEHFDDPRSAVASAEGLDHKEDQVHIAVLYRYLVSPKLDVTFGVGPTFFNVKQQLVPSVTVTDTFPVTSVSVTPKVAEGSDSAVGVNLSADATYMVTDMIGAGVLIRFARSTAEITTEEASQSTDVKAGGFQIAAGVRVRF